MDKYEMIARMLIDGRISGPRAEELLAAHVDVVESEWVNGADMVGAFGNIDDPEILSDVLVLFGGFVESQPEDKLVLAGRMYDPYRHDEDSVGFNNSYTGPSERELGGGCNVCGGEDDCYCD